MGGTERYTVAEAKRLGLLNQTPTVAKGKDAAAQREAQQAHALLRLLRDILNDGHDVRLEYHFHPTRRWRFDVALMDVYVALEIDGGGWIQGRHHRPKGRADDNDKANEAQALGWQVARVAWDHVTDGQAYQLLRRLALEREGNP